MKNVINTLKNTQKYFSGLFKIGYCIFSGGDVFSGRGFSTPWFPRLNAVAMTLVELTKLPFLLAKLALALTFDILELILNVMMDCIVIFISTNNLDSRDKANFGRFTEATDTLLLNPYNSIENVIDFVSEIIPSAFNNFMYLFNNNAGADIFDFTETNNNNNDTQPEQTDLSGTEAINHNQNLKLQESNYSSFLSSGLQQNFSNYNDETVDPNESLSDKLLNNNNNHDPVKRSPQF